MIKKIIGKGSYGTVYNINGVAVKKIVNEDNGINIIEPLIMANFRHNNLTNSLEIKVGNDWIWIYQELAEKDLASYLKDMKVINMERWTKDIMRGLGFLHSNCIIHSDIKSPNVLIFVDGRLKLTDFSLSFVKEWKEINYTDYSSGKWDRTICTATHRAPEIWLKKEYNHKVDIWSLGCLFFEMANRVNLFSGNLVDESTLKQFRTFFADPKEYIGDEDNYVNRLILRCLKLNPKERPTVKELLGEESGDDSDEDVKLVNTKEKLISQFKEMKNGEDLASFMENKILGNETKDVGGMGALESAYLKRVKFKLDFI